MAIFFGIAIVIAVGLPLVLLAIGIQVDVSRFGPLVAKAASEALGREVTVEGPIFVVPSYWPTLEIHGLHVADPYGPEGAEFAGLDEARIVLSLLPILRGRLEIDEIMARGVRLNLVRYSDERASWGFDLPAPEPDAPAEEPSPGDRQSMVFKELEELALHDVAVAFRDARSGESIDLVLDECLGAAAYGQPIRLTLRGSYQDEPFRARLGAGHIQDLLTSRPTLPLDMEIEIVGGRLEMGLQLGELEKEWDPEERPFAGAAGRYWLLLDLPDLRALTRLTGIELPPLGPVALRAKADLEPETWKLSELDLRVGETRLSGTATLVAGQARPRVTLDLRSRRFQVEDFRAEGWSVMGQDEPAPPDQPKEAPPADEEPSAGPPRRTLVDPEVMRLLDGRAELRVDEVVIGDEGLGGGELVITLEDGRFKVDPLHVRLPGGSFSLVTEFETGPAQVDARVAFEMQSFDLGVLARKARPGTDMGGRLDLDLDLVSRAPRTSEIMAHANGHVDVNLVPVNIEAGVLDLWAVNLVAAILPVVAEGESHVNCVVALLDMQDGVMRSSSLLIDTTRIQVQGEAMADFKQERVEAMLQPRPKRPQFFALKTPVSVSGRFEDFGVGVSPLDLAGTVIRLMTDVATFPARFLILKRVSPDGKEACAEALTRPPEASP